MNLQTQILIVISLLQADSTQITNLTQNEPHSRFLLTLLFTTQDKIKNDPKFTQMAQGIYCKKTGTIYEVLKEKPLRMLENLDQKFPPFISFHLRELYLRKNLPFEASKGNSFTFKHINDEFLHEYLTFFFSARINPTVISIYMQTLEESQ